MILTEEEAKTKRCQESYGPPLSSDGRMVTIQVGSYPPIQTSPTNCISAECMAWRWWGIRRTDRVTLRREPNLMPSGASDEIQLGYCGKAGKP